MDNRRAPHLWRAPSWAEIDAVEKMQAKQSTTEGRHDGSGIPSSTRPFAAANKNKQNEERQNI
jgi:hypothetical protein